jgi:hypothetical protein
VPITIYQGMNLDLNDEQTAALIRELHDIIESDGIRSRLTFGLLREILNFAPSRLANLCHHLGITIRRAPDDTADGVR